MEITGLKTGAFFIQYSASWGWGGDRSGFTYLCCLALKIITRLPGAVPQPIGLFLFCIEFGWG